MTTRRVFGLGLRTATPALMIVIAMTRDDGRSARMWLAGAVVWIAAVLVWDLLTVAALEPAKLRVAWRWRRGTSTYRGPVVQDVRSDLLLLRAALSDPRVHASRLRPRLTTVAKHFAPLRHGFNPERDPQRMRQLLGDVGWLLDPDERERAPTAAEIEQFLDIVLADERKGAA